MSETRPRSAEYDAGRLTEREREMLYAPDRRMDAYYYGFDPTGVPEIDAILSAVAHAGKGYHHTESWSDDPGEWGRYGPGRSMAEVIQAAANEAALAWEARPTPPGQENSDD